MFVGTASEYGTSKMFGRFRNLPTEKSQFVSNGAGQSPIVNGVIMSTGDVKQATDLNMKVKTQHPAKVYPRCME